MSGKESHFAVKFATRYGSPTANYLSAWVALIRLDELIEDAEILKGYLDKAEPEENRWHPWVGLEAASYYAVGFVTCLEWHARSRLVDLLAFDPKAVKSNDLRVVKDKVVVEMLAANLTVASVVGAATNISSFDEYIGVFSRLFSTTDPHLDGFKVIKSERPGTGKPWVDEDEIEELKALYLFRNELVHEIGITRVGHMNIRDRWSPTDAIRMGQLVRRVMKALEASVSSKMPPGFPNILDLDGFPVSEWQRLEAELPIIERKIGQLMTAFTEEAVEVDENWEPAKAAAANYLAKEMEFLDQSSMLFNRYVEMREPLRLALVKSRHAYLKNIIETVGSVWEIDDAPEQATPKESQSG